jgi:PII-like signaling protein
MVSDALTLTVYVGERDRHERQLLADVLMDAYARHGVHTSALLRGIEGFGIKHQLRTERLLTLSEDLPIVALAVDERPRIEALLAEVCDISREGLITLERTRLSSGPEHSDELRDGTDALKMTIYVGRGERVGTRPAYLAVVDCLHRCGLDGASVLLGLDGAAHGVRRRARFVSGNAQVPLMIVSVGDSSSVTRALEELQAMLSKPTVTLERVRVCRRDGVALADPHGSRLPADDAGLTYWHKLVVYASEQTLHDGEPLHGQLVRRLRSEGAAGATVLRGLWGYHGEHRPHGERFWSLRRHVPAITVLIDTPANTQRWFEVVAEMTAESGLVTSELVPALRASGPGVEHGGLRLAEPRARQGP